MKITKEQLKQIIKEELESVLKENDNIDFFAVVSPDGKVFRVKKSSKKVEDDPQKAINLAAGRVLERFRRGAGMAHVMGGVIIKRARIRVQKAGRRKLPARSMRILMILSMSEQNICNINLDTRARKVS